MRSHRRRGPLEHVMVAADVSELPAVRALLALLPEDAYGQVFLETPEDLPLDLATPARVSVLALTREPSDRPGDLLSVAAHAWVSEWSPDEPDPARSCAVWVGATCDALDAPLERL